MRRFFRIVIRIWQTAPPVPRIRANADREQWRAELCQLSGMEALKELRPGIEAVISDGFRTSERLDDFLDKKAADISCGLYMDASEVTLANLAEKPIGAWILSWISLLGFERWAERELPNTSYELFPPGWHMIPYACAMASAEIGSYTGAQELVTEVYAMLDSYRVQQQWRIQGGLELFRHLSGLINRKYEAAIWNLADDLRDSCRTGPESFRAEIGAIAWALGQVPESTCLRSYALAHTLSRRFFQQLVRKSMDLIPIDPLIQQVWLRLKDRGPFDIRKHEPLFTLINSRYHFSLTEMIPQADPLSLFADTLIAFFRGEIDRQLATSYLASSIFFNSFPPIHRIRMSALAALVSGKSHDHFSEQVDLWSQLTTAAAEIREKADLSFSPTPMSLRAFCGCFYFLESALSVVQMKLQPDRMTVFRIVEVIEKQRNSAFSHSMKLATPVVPIVSEDSRIQLQQLLEEERMCIQLAHGAYFETLLPRLPEHYGYCGSSGQRPDPASAPARFEKLLNDLDSVRNKMKAIAPSHVDQYAFSNTGLNGLVDVLGSHRSAKWATRTRRGQS